MFRPFAFITDDKEGQVNLCRVKAIHQQAFEKSLESIIFFLLLHFCFPDCPKEDEACQEDIVSLEAIKALHKQIDDDESGNIDKDESKEVCVRMPMNRISRAKLMTVVS